MWMLSASSWRDEHGDRGLVAARTLAQGPAQAHHVALERPQARKIRGRALHQEHVARAQAQRPQVLADVPAVAHHREHHHPEALPHPGLGHREVVEPGTRRDQHLGQREVDARHAAPRPGVRRAVQAGLGEQLDEAFGRPLDQQEVAGLEFDVLEGRPAGALAAHELQEAHLRA